MPQQEIPFNLENLRRHLAQLHLARRVLPEDVTARQSLLEASVHEVAAERFKHEDAIFKQLGLGTGLQEKNLQMWMWTWHQALVKRLEVTIKDIVKAEDTERVVKQSKSSYTFVQPSLLTTSSQGGACPFALDRSYVS
jgi:DNA-directed RNA polymerase